MGSEPSHRRRWSRRRFLAAAVGAGLVGVSASIAALRLASRPARRWSDGDSPGATSSPGREDVVRISDRVVLDGDVAVAGVTVERGGVLIFDPERETTLRTSGNIVIEGLLEMQPATHRVSHRIVFEGVDEEGFQGKGMDPLETDVGLWVVGSGRLVVAGARKSAWLRTADPVPTGARSIELSREPLGWHAGDEVAITPTLAPPDPNFATAFDVRRIRAVRGRVVELESPTSYAHPSIEAGGRSLTAEVLNLTRNVAVGGSPTGRSHVFIRSTRPSTIAYAALPDMGPRKGGEKIAGRWPLHFHHCADGSRGSLVEGVVVRNAGSHAFVAHASHGVALQDCVAFDVTEDAYWWDHEDRVGTDASNDILYADCVAALVRVGDEIGQYRLTGFKLEAGTGNVARGCVATGVQGAVTTSGFHWPEPPLAGVWEFQGCVAHNNVADGIFSWENDGQGNHDIVEFVAYRNGRSGIEHGAYANRFHFLGGLVADNGSDGIANRARSSSLDRDVSFRGFTIDGGGVTANGIRLFDNSGIPARPVTFVDVEILGVSVPILVKTKPADPIAVDLIRTVVGTGRRDLEPSDIVLEFMSPGSIIRVQRKDGRSAWQLDASGAVKEIAAFA